MTKEFYAHSKEGRPREEWQPLAQHLKNVAEMAAGFAEGFGSRDWAWNAGLFHDLGKATNAFQRYLREANGLSDNEYGADGSLSNHASAGAALAVQQLGCCIGRILAYLAAGHHAGLPDGNTAQTGNAALPARLDEGQRNLRFIQAFAEEIIKNIHADIQPPVCVRGRIEHFHMWVRMLFSCLVDADYLDTERFMDDTRTCERGRYPSIETLANKFFLAIKDLESGAQRSSVNTMRAEVRIACETAAELQKGLFSLTVPTGGGKTLSAMAFAFRHALKHRLHRVVYVIPYTSIIEQTADVLRRIVGKENVLEHHSNLAPHRESLRSQLAAENWDAPIVVTTNVQFFESLYAARASRCRKLHNIVNSVVILDEVQLLPPERLSPCIEVINQLARIYGVTVVLATATQPILSRMPKPSPSLENVREIIPSSMNLYERLQRVEYNPVNEWLSRYEWSDIAERLKQHDQVLCVLNSRRDCHDLFKSMPEGTIHLSTLMCGRHRSVVIRWIKLRLKRGLPTRVISTQLVEAGVDIDFPVVYRALAGLDSIAQAAGRCNREGRLNDKGKLGEVKVFTPPKSPPRGMLLKGENKTRELCRLRECDPQSPSSFSRYFNLFYGAVNDTGADWLHDMLVKDVNPYLNFQFRSAGEEFIIIDDRARRPVLVRYGRSGKLLNELRVIGPTRAIMRELQRYVVNLWEYEFDHAFKDGLIEEIYPGYWCWAPDYDSRIGLDIFSGAWMPENLVI